MKFGKTLAALLAAVMMILLCACGNGGSANVESPPFSDASETLPETSPEQSTEENSAPEESSENLPEDSSESEFESESEKPEQPEEPRQSVVSIQHSLDAEELDALYKRISAEKDFPAVNIYTRDGEAILSKERYVESVIDVFNCGDEFLLSAEGGVKVRGNSTANDDEKPYRIKFTEKQSMLGLHGGRAYKSWVLLRSFWNLAPDYTGFNLARTILDGKYYSSDCAYVNLYVNGQSRGVYLLCEQNQAAEGRVDVTEAKGDEPPTDIGYLLELDNYPDENEHPFFVIKHSEYEFTDLVGQTRRLEDACYSIRSDTTTRAQRGFIAKYLRNVYRILVKAAEGELLMFDENYDLVSASGIYSTAKEAVEAVIDAESLANYLILEELVQNYDVGEGSFYMAVDFGKNSVYPRLTFLAPWDFNWGYTEDPSAGYYACTFQPPVMDSDRSNVWFIAAMKQEWFADIVKEKWRPLSESGAIENTALAVKEHTALLANDLGEDAWKTDKAAEICAYVVKRKRWLDKQWLTE